MKADKVTGQIELAPTATNADDGGDGTVNTRRAYGVWKFRRRMSLKVGKDYSPVTDFISNQWFALTTTCSAKATSTAGVRPCCS